MNYFSLFLNLLNMTVENAAPYLLITIGGVFVARAGVFNISMEGCTEFAAFAGILFAFVTGQIWVGVIAAFVIAILLNCLFYLFTVKLKGNLSVVGSGINLMAACIPACLLQALYGTRSNLVASNIIDPAKMMLDVPVLRSIRENAHGGEMTRVRAGSGDGELVYCMLERGRDYYVYAYMPLTRALDTTPKNLLFTLVAYAMVLFIVIMIRWRLKHVYQEEQLRREQSYQQQLKDAARKAESANRAKTEFLQRMSHDIRTPINGIRGMVEIGDHYSEDLAKQAECRRKIWDASTLLLELVNEVLDMGKLESGEILLESCPFNVIELKDGIRQTMERAAAERGITMTDRTEVKHTTLIGSPLHLKRLLMNIWSNAIKYNKDNGSIDLTCREVRSDSKTAWIEFICADTGIGMSEEFQKHLYEPFTQEHSDARTSYNGTGLGMAITKSLVEKMGGTIECRSKLGEGTTYCITIPFAIDSSAAPRVEETAALPAATPEGMHVLLAEDNELNREIAVTLLEEQGAAITTAENGREAVELFQNAPQGTFDAVLMDVMMPELDGIRATAKLREGSNVPIILLTAKSEDADKLMGFECGADDYVTKPFNPQELAARVRSQLRRYTLLGDVHAEERQGLIVNGRLTYDPDRRELRADGEAVKLTATETKIVDLLMRNPGRIFPAEEIYRRVWDGEAAYACENTVMVHIRRIREKIELNPKEPDYIKVVWGIGYKMEQHGT